MKKLVSYPGYQKGGPKLTGNTWEGPSGYAGSNRQIAKPKTISAAGTTTQKGSGLKVEKEEDTFDYEYKSPNQREKELESKSQKSFEEGYSDWEQSAKGTATPFNPILDAVNPFSVVEGIANIPQNIRDGEYLSAGMSALSALPVVGGVGKAITKTGQKLNTAVKQYGKELVVTSKEAGKLKLPTYTDRFRVEPTSWKKDASDEFSGRWFGHREDMPFYIENLKDPNSNVRLIRTKMSDRVWNNISGKNMPHDAKRMSAGPGDYGTWNNAVNEGVISRRTLKAGDTDHPEFQNTSLYNPKEGIVSDYLADHFRKGTSDKISRFKTFEGSSPNAMKEVFNRGIFDNKLLKPIEKYIPYTYQDGGENYNIKGYKEVPKQKKYGGLVKAQKLGTFDPTKWQGPSGYVSADRKKQISKPKAEPAGIYTSRQKDVEGDDMFDYSHKPNSAEEIVRRLESNPEQWREPQGGALVPIDPVGDAVNPLLTIEGISQIPQDIREGEYLSAAMNAAEAIPFVGAAFRGLKKVIPKTIGTREEFIDIINAIKNKKAQNIELTASEQELLKSTRVIGSIANSGNLNESLDLLNSLKKRAADTPDDVFENLTGFSKYELDKRIENLTSGSQVKKTEIPDIEQVGFINLERTPRQPRRSDYFYGNDNVNINTSRINSDEDIFRNLFTEGSENPINPDIINRVNLEDFLHGFSNKGKKETLLSRIGNRVGVVKPSPVNDAKVLISSISKNSDNNPAKRILEAYKKVADSPKGSSFIPARSLSSDSYNRLSLPLIERGLKNDIIDLNYNGFSSLNSMGFPTKAGLKPELIVKEINSQISNINKLTGKQYPFAKIKDGEVLYPEFTVTRKQQGGIITDPAGQWKNPGKNTRIPSNRITMDKVNHPVLAITDKGVVEVQLPGEEYLYADASYVDEIPLGRAQAGVSNPPIIVRNPRDPRLLAYQDSLNLHTVGNKRLNSLRASDPTNEGFTQWMHEDKDNFWEEDKLKKKLFKLNNEFPESSDSYQHPSANTYGGVRSAWEYAAPKQKVIYKQQDPVPDKLSSKFIDNIERQSTERDFVPLNISISNLAHNPPKKYYEGMNAKEEKKRLAGKPYKTINSTGTELLIPSGDTRLGSDPENTISYNRGEAFVEGENIPDFNSIFLKKKACGGVIDPELQKLLNRKIDDNFVNSLFSNNAKIKRKLK